ncbi:MAG: nucleoside transporter C-terminal domain-containing protein, partial [Acidobacteriota bacterium]
AIIYLIDGILAAVGTAFASLRNVAILLAVIGGITAAYVFGWNPSARRRNIVMGAAAAAIIAVLATYAVRGGTPIELGLSSILAMVFAPLAYLMGVPWAEAATVGQLFGIKLVLNEFVAYTELSGLLARGALSPKAELIASYALCGFANFSSIGIQIGGIGGLAPSRRSDLAKLGLRAVLAGMLSSFTVATLAGILSGL